MFKLNGWQRLGVILSIVWLLGSGIYINRLVTDSGMKSMVLVLNLCLDSSASSGGQNTPSCTQKADDVYQDAVKNRYRDIAALTLIPLPIFWVLVYLAIFLYRWVCRGFKGDNNV